MSVTLLPLGPVVRLLRALGCAWLTSSCRPTLSLVGLTPDPPGRAACPLVATQGLGLKVRRSQPGCPNPSTPSLQLCCGTSPQPPHLPSQGNPSGTSALLSVPPPCGPAAPSWTLRLLLICLLRHPFIYSFICP